MLGSSAAVLEFGERPRLLIDCGPDTLESYLSTYGEVPNALFITHAHFDHIGGLEGLFYRLATSGQHQALLKLFVPVALIPVLQRRLADYPNLLAEGGSNFWDVFQLIPVTESIWYRHLSFDVFPVRHHSYQSAFGIALRGAFFYSGDTRPIPEVINRFASHGELIFHDCCTNANPSHTSIEDIKNEYKKEQWGRMVLYHYESHQAGEAVERSGLIIARRGDRFDLGDRPSIDQKTDSVSVCRLPEAVGS
jgi:ribonuclease BN (tRNA processing enzyme)